MVAIYLMGIPYIYLINILVLKNPVPLLKILLGMIPFMVGDVIKSLIVAGVAPVIVERVSKI
jgi:biotin transporter BioY